MKKVVKVRSCYDCPFFDPCDPEMSGFGPCFDHCTIAPKGKSMVCDDEQKTTPDWCPLRKRRVTLHVEFEEKPKEQPKKEKLKAPGVRKW